MNNYHQSNELTISMQSLQLLLNLLWYVVSHPRRALFFLWMTHAVSTLAQSEQADEGKEHAIKKGHYIPKIDLANHINGIDAAEFIAPEGESFSFSMAKRNCGSNQCLIFGAPLANGGRGAVYDVVLGPHLTGKPIIKVAFDEPHILTLKGNRTHGFVGWSVGSFKSVDSSHRDGLLIGAPNQPHDTQQKGEGYVLFDGGKLQNVTEVILSADYLDGNNGLTITNNLSPNPFTGSSVSQLGDINNDTFPDIAICAPNVNVDSFESAGACYPLTFLALLGNNYTFPTQIELTDLPISFGFTILGDGNNFNLGKIIYINDFNGDGIPDLGFSASNEHGIGAFGALYGSQFIGQQGNISISNINGTNGFMIEGIADKNSLYFAYHIANLGNIYADGFSAIGIGAQPDTVYESKDNIVITAVIKARPGFTSPNIDLLSLNGDNGFRVVNPLMNPGKMIQDSMLVGADDFNGDGGPDLLIINKQHFNLNNPNEKLLNQTKIHLLFDVLNQQKNGTLNVADLNLNGINGIEIYDSRDNTTSFGHVFLLADVNGDGYNDGVFASPGKSKAIVFYSNPLPLLMRNAPIPLTQNQSIAINSTHLLVEHKNHDPKDILIHISTSPHLDIRNSTGHSVRTVTQADLNHGNNTFLVHDGKSKEQPTFSFEVTSGVGMIDQTDGQIDFSLIRPKWIKSEWAAYLKAHPLNEDNIDIEDLGVSDDKVWIKVKHDGKFQFLKNGNTVSEFTLADVKSGIIEFYFWGGNDDLDVVFDISDGYNYTPPLDSHEANIKLIRQPLFNCTFEVVETTPLTLTFQQLSVKDYYTPPSEFEFEVISVEEGAIYPKYFTGQTVEDNQVILTPKNRQKAISAKLKVTGKATTRSAVADCVGLHYFHPNISLINPPFIDARNGQDSVKIDQLTFGMRDEDWGTAPRRPDDKYHFYVSNVKGGTFRISLNPTFSFSLRELKAGVTDFKIDNSNQPPSAMIKLYNGRLNSTDIPFNFRFIAREDHSKSDLDYFYEILPKFLGAFLGASAFALLVFMRRIIQCQQLAKPLKEELKKLQKTLARPEKQELKKIQKSLLQGDGSNNSNKDNEDFEIKVIGDEEQSLVASQRENLQKQNSENVRLVYKEIIKPISLKILEEFKKKNILHLIIDCFLCNSCSRKPVKADFAKLLISLLVRIDKNNPDILGLRNGLTMSRSSEIKAVPVEVANTIAGKLSYRFGQTDAGCWKFIYNKFSFNINIFPALQEDNFLSKIAKEVCDDELIQKAIKQRQATDNQAKLKNIKKSLSEDLWHKLLTCCAMLRCCNKSSNTAENINSASINDVNARSHSTCSNITACISMLFCCYKKASSNSKKAEPNSSADLFDQDEIDQPSDRNKSSNNSDASLKSKLQGCCCFWRNGDSKNDGGIPDGGLAEKLLNRSKSCDSSF